MNKKFTYASAFAGIGGMSMGFKPLGGECVMAWEYDPTEKRTQYAQNAHRLLHPEITVQGDICEANTDSIPDFDVFCFTPPCQAFSLAGKRRGFEDTRGTLIFEVLRIAKAKRPKVLFMENVKGLLSHDNGNTLSTIIHAINEIGYVVDFSIIDSKYFNVAQSRERLYLIAIREDLIDSSTHWIDTENNSMLQKKKREYIKDGVRMFNFDFPEQKEIKTRIIDFLEESVDESYYLSNNSTNNNLELKNPHQRLSYQTLELFNRYEGIRGDCDIIQPFNRLYITNGITPTLTTRPEGLKTAILLAIKHLSVDELNGASQDITGNYTYYRIRKLTPIECLRLQTIPPEAIEKLKDNFSNSRIYKFAGNGLTINVIKSIGERILKYI